MYQNFFGLRRAPFQLTPDPEFLHMTEQHREALAGLTYAMLARRGFVVLTGYAGTGKTTLLRRVLQHAPADKLQSSVIVNPTLSAAEFLEAAMLDFGLTNIPASKAQRIAMLQEFLWATARAGKVAALIVDEAHKLTPELLEEIRLLGNFETADEKLLQVVLVGQEELDKILSQEGMSQFKQRIALRLTIGPLAESEVGRYVQDRWTRAGGDAAPFTAAAIDAIAMASRGIPRVINLLCDNCLLLALGEQSKTVDRGHVVSVCSDLRFDLGVRKVSAPPKVEGFAFKTLARYEVLAERPSWARRVAGRLRLTQRTELA